MVRSYEKEFKEIGIDLSQEFEEAEKELRVKPSTAEIQASGSRAIYEAALSLGYICRLCQKLLIKKSV